LGTEEKRETKFRSSTNEIFETLTGNNKLDKEKNQCIREKTGAQNIVKEIKQYQKKWLKHVQRMDTNRLPRQVLKYRPEEDGTLDDRRRDGGTNSTLRIKEQETRLTLQEYDDDDNDECFVHTVTLFLLYVSAYI